MGHANIPLRLGLELAFKRHFFYDKPVGELSNGRLIRDLTNGLERLGPLGQPASDYIKFHTGLYIVHKIDPRTGDIVDIPIVVGTPNWMIQSTPWSRLFKQAGAYTDVLSLDMAADIAGMAEEGFFGAEPGEPLGGYPGLSYLEDVSAGARALEALTGLRVTQRLQAWERRIYERQIEDMVNAQIEARGLTRTAESVRLKE